MTEQAKRYMRQIIGLTMTWVLLLQGAVSTGGRASADPSSALPATPGTDVAKADTRAAALAALKPVSADEVVERRSANSRTFRTANGYRVEMFPEAIHYETQPGVFATIDNTLVPVTDGSPFAFQNKANAWRVRFSNQPGQNQMRVDTANRWFTFDLDGGTGKDARAYHGTANGAQITYDAGGDDALQYQVSNALIKENIVLRRPTVRSAWSFPLHVQGYVATRYDDGHIGLAYDSSVSEEVWTLSRVFAVDAAGARVDGTLQLEKKSDGLYVVTESVDPQWLNAPDRKYPVVVDPTYALAGYGSNGQWTVIQQGVTSLFSGSDLEVKGDGSIKSLIKFGHGDSAAYFGNSGMRLNRARIFLNPDDSASYCPKTYCSGDTLTVQPLAQDWYPSHVTWTYPRGTNSSWTGGDPCNATKCPGLPSTALSSSIDMGSRETTSSSCFYNYPCLHVDVTSAVQAMLDASQPNYGFVLSSSSPYGAQSDAKFHSTITFDQYGDTIWPQLLILDYVADTTPPTTSITNVSDGSTLSSTFGNPPSPVQVWVRAEDTDNTGVSVIPARVQLLVDDNVVDSQEVTGQWPYFLNVNPANFLPGPHRMHSRVYDQAGNHTDSPLVHVTFGGGVLPPPDNVHLVAAGSGSYNLTWNPVAPQPPNTVKGVQYLVENSTTADFASPTQVGTTSNTTLAVSGNGYYRVRTQDMQDGSLGAYSNVASARAPSSPTGLVAQPLANGSVALQWQASSDSFQDSGITYQVYRSTSGGTATVVLSGLTTTQWTDTGATAGTTYSYQVSAINKASLESSKSPVINVTAATSSGPDAPTGVLALSGRAGSVSVVWNSSSNTAITYNISRSTDRTNWVQIASGLSGWFYNDCSLTSGITYYYQVQSVLNGQGGPRSLTAGAMAVASRRLGIDDRWPVTSVAAGDGTAYLNLQNGNLVFDATDSVVAAPYLPVVIRRTYNSQGGSSGTLGGQWRLNTDWRIEDFGSTAVLTTGDGTEHTYTFDGTNYHGDIRWYWTLSKDTQGNFVVTRPDRVVLHFGSNGWLASIVERNGNTITYHYDPNNPNRLVSITDPVGRTTQLNYDPQGNLVSVVDGANRTTQYAYDANGRLASVTDAASQVTTYQYDAYGHLVFAQDSAGRGTAFTYDDTGRITSITDGLGDRTTVAYATNSAGGGTTTVTDPLGGNTTLAYDANGFMTSLTDAVQNQQATPKSWTYAYAYRSDDVTKLQSETITNPQGLRTYLGFDAMGNVIESVDQGTDLTAPGTTTRVTRMAYASGSSDLMEIIDPENHASTKNWSTAAPYWLQSVSDPLNHTTTYTPQCPTQCATGPQGLIAVVTDPNGNQAKYSYDSLGNVTQVSHIMDTTKTLVQTMTYNADGSVATVSDLHDPSVTVDPKSDAVTRTVYDSLGRKIRVEYPDGSMEAWVYNGSGAVAMQVSRGGQAASYAYDAVGRLVVQSDNLGNQTKYSYDVGGNATAITDANGHTNQMVYDLLHRVTKKTDPNGLVSKLQYDEMGRTTAVTTGPETAGYQVTASYYLLGGLRQVTEPLLADSVLPATGAAPTSGTIVNNTQTFTYDRNGKQVTLQDGNGRTTRYVYDALGRPVKIIDPNNGITGYGYDANGNRTDVWNANGNHSQYAFDALNRQSTTTDPLGYKTTQTYTDAGDVGQTTDPNGATITYAYDAGHRPVDIHYPNHSGNGPTVDVQYVYDGAGRKLFRNDSQGIARYSYDALGRPLQALGPAENSQFQFDNVGNVTGITSSLGQVTYTYDPGNRVQKVQDPLKNSTVYLYDLYGHVSQVLLPNGMQRTYSYYALPGSGSGSGPVTNRMQTINTTNSAGTLKYWQGTYQYDYVGNVRNISGHWDRTANACPTDASGTNLCNQTSISITSTYDNLDRLTDYTDNSLFTTYMTYHYRYDRMGNRLQWGNDGNYKGITYAPPYQFGNAFLWQTTEYDADNRPTREWTAGSSGDQLASAGVTSDNNGNLTQEKFQDLATNATSTVSYGYDDANRLVSYSGNGYSASYTYDGEGRRVKWNSGGETNYEYVGSDIVSERGGDGNTNVWYVSGAKGEKLYTLTWNTTNGLTANVYAKDHLGTIKQVVDSSGNTQDWYLYDPFGQVTKQYRSLVNSYEFASAPLDSVYSSSTSGYSTFYNLNARLYNPATGRFLTQDTYRGNPWAPWTQNLYAYVGNNPVNMVDPTGHEAAAVDSGGCSDLQGQDCLETFKFILQVQQMSENDLMQLRVLGCGLTSADTNAGLICSAANQRALALGNSDLAGWFTTDDGGVPFQLPHPGELSAFADALGTVEYGKFSEGLQNFSEDQVGARGPYRPVPKRGTYDFLDSLVRVKAKSQRARWEDADGYIYEWDYENGRLEKYNTRGKHLGEFDPGTGAQTKDADPGRRIQP